MVSFLDTIILGTIIIILGTLIIKRISMLVILIIIQTKVKAYFYSSIYMACLFFN